MCVTFQCCDLIQVMYSWSHLGRLSLRRVDGGVRHD